MNWFVLCFVFIFITIHNIFTPTVHKNQSWNFFRIKVKFQLFRTEDTRIITYAKYINFKIRSILTFWNITFESHNLEVRSVEKWSSFAAHEPRQTRAACRPFPSSRTVSAVEILPLVSHVCRLLRRTVATQVEATDTLPETKCYHNCGWPSSSNLKS